MLYRRLDVAPGADAMAQWRRVSGGRDFRAAGPEQRAVVPRRPRPLVSMPPTGPVPPRVHAAGPLLLGAIDNGCPFAHPMLRRHGSPGTRVLAIWDQDPVAPAFVHAGGGAAGAGRSGCVVTRPALDALVRTGESAAYASAGCDVLRWGYGHGAAVLGLLAGAVSPHRPVQVRHAGLDWIAPLDDAASRADIAFVQLARDLVQDSSSAALTPALLSGLDFIVEHAGPATRRIVVNISDGTSRGAHDGQSHFERGVAQRVAALQRTGIELVVVVPAGNSRIERRHAELAPGQPGEDRVLLHLPPDSETAAFVTVRIPGGAAGAQFRLVPPGPPPGAETGWALRGRSVGWSPAAGGRPVAAVLWPETGPDAGTALLAFSPTRDEARPAEAAPHGLWQIQTRLPGARGDGATLQLWISRNARNVGALPRSVQARFVDVDDRYEPDRHLRDRLVDAARQRGPIRRRGTLNELAAGGSVWVAGGQFRRAHPDPWSPYSAQGPSLGVPARPRDPRHAAVTDESWAQRGILAAGNLGGQIVRVIGTSFAAPQLARWLADRPLP